METIYMEQLVKAKIVSSISPLLIVTGTTSLCLTVQKYNRVSSIYEIIPPVFLLFFISPLFANLVYPQMIITKDLVIFFFVGILLFFILRRIKYSKYLNYLGIIGKIQMLIDMKNNKQPVENVVMWLLVNEFIGIIVRKIVLEGCENYYTENFYLMELISTISILIMCKMFKLPDIYFVIMILGMSLLKILVPKISKPAESKKINKNGHKNENIIVDGLTMIDEVGRDINNIVKNRKVKSGYGKIKHSNEQLFKDLDAEISQKNDDISKKSELKHDKSIKGPKRSVLHQKNKKNEYDKDLESLENGKDFNSTNKKDENLKNEKVGDLTSVKAVKTKGKKHASNKENMPANNKSANAVPKKEKVAPTEDTTDKTQLRKGRGRPKKN